MGYTCLLVLQGQNEALGIEFRHLALGQSLVKISRVKDDLALELLTFNLRQQYFFELLSHQQSTIIYHANNRNRSIGGRCINSPFVRSCGRSHPHS